MSDLDSIVRAARNLRDQGEPFLVATVVRVDGSAYRRPGARMLLTEQKWIAGSVSGGCLEGDLVKKGWWRTRSGAPEIVRYDTRTDGGEIHAAFGLGCEGVVEVLLERAGSESEDPLCFVERCFESEERGAIATVVKSDRSDVPAGARAHLRAGESRGVLARVAPEIMLHLAEAIERGTSSVRAYTSDQGMIEVAIEAVVPPPHLFVFGKGHDVEPLVQLARSIGWKTTICSRPAQRDEVLACVDRSDRGLAMVMSHNYEQDEEVLERLMTSKARYIGVLGPKKRTARMLAQIGRDDPRIHGPAGLDLGAETPAEIALSIVAEMQAVLTGGSGAKLRTRGRPIHETA